MEKCESYVYFALKGEIDPDIITKRLQLEPTKIRRKGEAIYSSNKRYPCSSWELSTDIGKEYLDINSLVKEVLDKLTGLEDEICSIKSEFELCSILEIKLDIDTNPESSTPYIGHDLSTIEFLYRTGTETDVDIYTFNSAT